MNTAKKILVVEDTDQKFEDLSELISASCKTTFELTRAKTVVEATDSIEKQAWDLVVLDISMDIAQGSGNSREAHANLGGMDILEQMFLLEREALTVIVTGFDYFIRSGIDTERQDAQTFGDLENQARKWIGDKLLGCVRYGSPNWVSQLEKLLETLQ